MKIKKILKSKVNLALIIIIAVLVLISIVKALPASQSKSATVVTTDPYVAFESDVYDTIKKNYWNSDKTDLDALYEVAIQKIAGPNAKLSSKDKAGIEKLIASTTAKMEEKDKKNFVATLAQVVLFNLLPVGRNALYTQVQETAMRNEVKNVNTSRSLYDTLGVTASATPSEIEKSYTKLATKLKSEPKSTTTEQKLKDLAYSRRVLTDAASKTMYDTTKIEPTMLIKPISPSVLYMNMTKFSPTTLNEFANGLTARAGDGELKALIIDMRGNIGGAIDYLPYFTGAFVGFNLSAYDVYSRGTTTPIKTAISKFDPLIKFKKIVVLVDNLSQSSAEALTASLKRYHAAVIVGTTTRGWGTIENTFPIKTVIDPSQSFSLYLVHSLTLREDGQPIEGSGVKPDVDLSKPNWKAQLDDYYNYEPLNKAIESLKKSGPLNS